MARVDLRAEEFCRGILLGFVAIDTREVELLSPASHFAALKVFKHLQATASEQFNFRFRIILDSVYRESDTWNQAVRFQQLSGMTVLYDNTFEIQAYRDDLDDLWFLTQVGPRSLWEDCARLFRTEVSQHPLTH